MGKEVLNTALLCVVALIAIALMVVKPVVLPETGVLGLFGHRADWDHDEWDRRGGAEFTATPDKVAEGQKVTLTVEANSNVKSVRFVAKLGRCILPVGIDNKKPFTMTWTAGGCGAGKYTLIALTKARFRFTDADFAKVTVTKKPAPVYTVVPESTVTLASDDFGRTISTMAYPPEPGSSGSQNIATFQTPMATTANEQLQYVFDITGQKDGTASYNLDYRIFDQTAGTVLASGSLPDPTEATDGTITVTTASFPPGTQHTILFQFKSSSDFNPVRVVAFEATIYRLTLQ